MRLFKTEVRPDGVIEERYSTPEGNIHRKLSQDVDGIMQYVQDNAEVARGQNRHYLGSVPTVIAQMWARECGHAIGTVEFGEFAKKRILDPNYKRFSTGLRS